MATYYHVIPQWDGSDLVSLRAQYVTEQDAIETFLERWPEAGAELATAHVHYVHLYADEAAARSHLAWWMEDGGELLVIEDPNEDLDVTMDHCEFAHPVSLYPIPAAYIRRA